MCIKITMLIICIYGTLTRLKGGEKKWLNRGSVQKKDSYTYWVGHPTMKFHFSVGAKNKHAYYNLIISMCLTKEAADFCGINTGYHLSESILLFVPLLERYWSNLKMIIQKSGQGCMHLAIYKSKYLV